MMARNSAVLLNAAQASVTSDPPVKVDRYRYFSFFVETTNIGASGATLKIQTLAPSGNWIDLDSRAITANGSYIVSVQGAFELVRANLTRTDGTYTVTMNMAD